MNWSSVDKYIRQIDANVWKKLLYLHHSYKTYMYQKTADNCQFLACFEESEQIALEVIEQVKAMPERLINGFQLASYSYDELRDKQRITRKNLSRKADISRRNIRRYLNMHVSCDTVQGQFDYDKKEASRSYIVVHDSNSENGGLSAYDLKQYNLKRRSAINLAIAGHIEDFAHNYLEYEGLFLTLTLESEHHISSYEDAKNEITKRWKKIKSALRYRDILYLGVEVIELHDDETPHYHIQLYVKPEYKELLKRLIFKHFPNEIDRSESCIKTIYDAVSLMRYMQKDSDCGETYVNFIGLTRDIKQRYNSIYNNRKYKDISDYKTSKSHQIAKSNKPNGLVLLLIRGFSDDRLNSLSSRNIDSHYIYGSYQMMMMSYISSICIQKVMNYFDEKKEKKEIILWYEIVNVFNDIYIFLLTSLYINQVYRIEVLHRWEIEKTRGQPPPFWGRLDYFLFGSTASYHRLKQIRRNCKNMMGRYEDSHQNTLRICKSGKPLISDVSGKNITKLLLCQCLYLSLSLG